MKKLREYLNPNYLCRCALNGYKPCQASVARLNARHCPVLPCCCLSSNKRRLCVQCEPNSSSRPHTPSTLTPTRPAPWLLGGLCLLAIIAVVTAMVGGVRVRVPVLVLVLLLRKVVGLLKRIRFLTPTRNPNPKAPRDPLEGALASLRGAPTAAPRTK